MDKKNIPLKVIEKFQLIQKQVCFAYELGWSEGVESARQEIKDEKLNNEQLAHDATALLKECFEYVKDDTSQSGMALYNKINAVLAQQNHA